MTGGDTPVTRRIRISGKVQGVWYRGWTVETATRLGLSGWVRNRRDGTVEALAHGPESAVRAFVAACANGPPAARVTDVAAEPAAAAAEDLTGVFAQRPTA